MSTKHKGMQTRAIVRVLAIIAALVCTAVTAHAQVANYSTGKPGTASFEQLSFWVKDGKRAEIVYAYGRDFKEVELTYVGVETWKGVRGFKVQFTNGRALHVAPKGSALRVEGDTYLKTFRWQYEGPVNGRGTFCDACAEDEGAAMKLLRAYFLQ